MITTVQSINYVDKNKWNKEIDTTSIIFMDAYKDRYYSFHLNKNKNIYFVIYDINFDIIYKYDDDDIDDNIKSIKFINGPLINLHDNGIDYVDYIDKFNQYSFHITKQYKPGNTYIDYLISCKSPHDIFSLANNKCYYVKNKYYVYENDKKIYKTEYNSYSGIVDILIMGNMLITLTETHDGQYLLYGTDMTKYDIYLFGYYDMYEPKLTGINENAFFITHDVNYKYEYYYYLLFLNPNKKTCKQYKINIHGWLNIYPSRYYINLLMIHIENIGTYKITSYFYEYYDVILKEIKFNRKINLAYRCGNKIIGFGDKIYSFALPLTLIDYYKINDENLSDVIILIYACTKKILLKELVNNILFYFVSSK